MHVVSYLNAGGRYFGSAQGRYMLNLQIEKPLEKYKKFMRSSDRNFEDKLY